MKLEIIGKEELTFGEDVVGTIDLNNNISIDVVDILLHTGITDIPFTKDMSYELFVYRRDGTGDYTPLDVSFAGKKDLTEWYDAISDEMLPEFEDYVKDIVN